MRTVLRLAVIGCVAAAVLLVELTSSRGVGWRLSTFTYQATILAAAYYLWAFLSPRADRRVGLQGALVLYVVMAGLIWNLLLTDKSMGYTPANVLLHVVVPVLVLADWLWVNHDDTAVRWWQPIAWLIYPAAYVFFALLVLNHAGRRAPYFFLDPGSVGAAGVALNVAGLAVLVLALGYGLMWGPMLLKRLPTPFR